MSRLSFNTTIFHKKFYTKKKLLFEPRLYYRY